MYVVRFLNEEESKELLCDKVFGDNIICPHQHDKDEDEGEDSLVFPPFGETKSKMIGLSFPLKCLALTCNGQLPSTISKLFNLKVLIIHPHMSIDIVKCYDTDIPKQIWDMTELEHIEILGKILVTPPNDDHVVASLSSYAFRGSKWETREQSFLSLDYLVSDLVEWKPTDESFPELCYVCFRSCYKLKKLHYWPSNSKFAKMELEECNPLGVACAKKLGDEAGEYLSVTASDHYEA